MNVVIKKIERKTDRQVLQNIDNRNTVFFNSK